MLQDELAKLTLTELEKRDERQDVERVCQLFNLTITSQWKCHYFSVETLGRICDLYARFFLPLHRFSHRMITIQLGYRLEHLSRRQKCEPHDCCYLSLTKDREPYTLFNFSFNRVFSATESFLT